MSVNKVFIIIFLNISGRENPDLVLTSEQLNTSPKVSILHSIFSKCTF